MKDGSAVLNFALVADATRCVEEMNGVKVREEEEQEEGEKGEGGEREEGRRPGPGGRNLT